MEAMDEEDEALLTLRVNILAFSTKYFCFILARSVDLPALLVDFWVKLKNNEAYHDAEGDKTPLKTSNLL